MPAACQPSTVPAAVRYVDKRSGVKDFDVWSFYVQHDYWPVPPRVVAFSNVGPVEDEEVSTSESYRVVVTRDGPAWIARTYGPHLPGEGREVSASTLAGVKDEAERQQYTARSRAPERNDAVAKSTNWSYEYHLGPGTDSSLGAFRQARMALWQAEADRAERGHQAAVYLAGHNATLAEIADILDVCCAAEAAELLTYSGPGLVALTRCPHEPPAPEEPFVISVTWWFRDLADFLCRKLHAVSCRRLVSRV